MTRNEALQRAARAKHDEFYTQITDIENELGSYTRHFEGSRILCNCDEPDKSSFFKYFADNFSKYRLAKLTATCYSSSGMAYLTEMNSDGCKITGLQGNGDFRSPECIDLLKNSDIVVTNPPFSLLREFIELLVSHDKKFIILANINVLTCKNIFPLLMQNKIRLGHSIHSGDVKFTVPDDYPLDALFCGVGDDGRKFVRVKSVRWLTNLDHGCKMCDIPLTRNYTPEAYPKYDNYDAIEVSRSLDIPKDYYGIMGVPLTFLDKYNPEQFEILGITEKNSPFMSKDALRSDRAYLNGKRIYARILIKRKEAI